MKELLLINKFYFKDSAEALGSTPYKGTKCGTFEI
jgi:hypothetical protein